MNLIQSYLTESGCYRAGKHITVQGLMIHSVGCPQPKADVFMKNWNRADANACVHAIIEPDGDVYQLLPWEHRGWHCGGNANNTHIGVEMTEPATIRYTGGASWTETGDGENTKVHVLATYGYAVELFTYLCKQYHLDPMADGVVISHSEGCRRGIASNHGDVEHLWSKFGLSMGQFRKDIKAAMEGSSDTDSLTAIMGKPEATAGQMAEYLKKKNPAAAQSVLDMVPLYLSEGEAEGVRGDLAFAQSCLETGNFTFSGSAVTLSQNNFCGFGVTQRGKKGLSFDTPQFGIRAQVQHGYAGFLFTDKNGYPEVAMHWEHRFNHMVKRYNDIYRVQMPNITPHICRHTYCSNMAKSGMNPKTLQYLMGHSDIGVTLNTYTHLGLEDATDELKRMEELENARKELEKNKEEKPVSQKMFRAI